MKRNGTAAATAILLIGAAVAVVWLAIAPLVLGSSHRDLDGPLAKVGEPEQASAPLMDGMRMAGSIQVSQPRDPFRPLVTEDSGLIAGGGTGTAGGTGGGGGTDTGGFEPSGTRVRLVEIREVGGVLRATVTVDGTSFDVGVGDTFADSFRVVAIDEDGVVILFRDNAFELSEGQEILK